MAQYTWDFDATTGVFKNNALSADVYETALQNSVAMRFVEVQSEFGKNKGESLTFTRFTHIAEPASALLSEQSPIPEVQFSLATSSFVINEYGVAVPYTGKLEALAKFNIENLVQRTLMEQKRLVLDSLALANFKLTNFKYVPASTSTGTATYNSTPSGTAIAGLNYFHIEDISSTMFDQLNVPYFEGENYVGIFRGKSLTALRRDSQFISWNQYTTPGVKAKGEIGTIERIRLVETNHGDTGVTPSQKGLGYVGSNSFGEGVVFGQDAVGMIEAETPHLRAALPAGHGRFKSIAWYGMLGFNIIFSGATTLATSQGTTRVCHVTSA